MYQVVITYSVCHVKLDEVIYLHIDEVLVIFGAALNSTQILSFGNNILALLKNYFTHFQNLK